MKNNNPYKIQIKSINLMLRNSKCFISAEKYEYFLKSFKSVLEAGINFSQQLGIPLFLHFANIHAQQELE